MPHPKKRKTKSSNRKGRAHLALKTKKLNVCPKCGKPKLPHHACAFCGTYKGEQIIKIKARKKTEKKKAQERRDEDRVKSDKKKKKKK
jgi:large subunit ribosomal protein L32